MSRIIGLRDLHIFPLETDNGSAAPTYGDAKKVPSLVSMDIQDNTESITFYSDDVAEQVIQAFTGKEVTIELGYLSNELEALISGNDFDKETGVFSQSADAVAKEIGLAFRAPKSKGGNFQYVVLYKGVLAREGSNYKTKEEKTDPSNIKLKGVFMPLAYNGKVASKLDSEDKSTKGQAIIDSWFTKPYIKENARAASLATEDQNIKEKK